MSDTVFNKVDYTLGALIHKIELGEIGLPDIQRPFVSKNTKVRDLFDLAGFGNATAADQFVSRLQHVCDVTLTSDFWEVTLPTMPMSSGPTT